MKRLNRKMATRSIGRVLDARGKAAGMGVFVGDFFITACHCILALPEGPGARVLASLHGGHIVQIASLDLKTKSRALVRFADPVADLAVFESYDTELLTEEFEPIREQHKPASVFVEPFASRPAVTKRRSKYITQPVQVLTHNGLWLSGTATGRSLKIDGGKRIESGTSGSPVFDASGLVVGVISMGNGPENMMSLLWSALPGGLLDDLLQWRFRLPG